MAESRDYRTPQEQFWAGEFGAAYMNRNQGDALLTSNVHFFSQALRTAGAVTSCLEFGANIGMNLKALRTLHPGMTAQAVEINPEAARVLADLVGPENVHCGSLLDYEAARLFDLTLVKGVLIHIGPDALPVAYDRLYRASARLILVAEYYNPTPVSVPYRGHSDRLLKRDFAGKMLDRYSNLRLRDYGFVYRRDPHFPQDDVTWFLLEKH